MSKVQGLLFGLATVVLVAAATYAFATRSWLLPMNSDRVGIDTAIGWSLLVTGIVFIGTNLLLAFFAWRYQDAPGAKAAYWHDDPKLELTWTIVTALILIAFLVNALNLWANVTAPAPADAMVIEVTGQQFAWNVRYPGKDGVFGRTDAKLVEPDEANFIGRDKTDPAGKDDIVTQGHILLAAGKPVRVMIRSLDVVHSFFLPHLRVKQDAMPGMTVETWFVPQKPGWFEIACAQHCGLGHYKMRGSGYVLSPEQLTTALASQQAFDSTIDALEKEHEKTLAQQVQP
jgi:cytochrome c oxidase subunit 2